MSLRRRLILIHSAFALFSLGAAFATIYAVRLQVRQAAERFELLVDEVRHLDACIADLKTLDVHLHEVTTGGRPADDRFQEEVRGMLMRIRELARYSLGDAEPIQRRILQLTDRLETELKQVTELVQAGALTPAAQRFKEAIEQPLLAALEDELARPRQAIESDRQHASRALLEKDSQLLVIASLIGVSGVALVVAGALIVRRRLVQPIETLQKTARTFAGGDLDYRVALPAGDELGQLGDAMNQMAQALQHSQRKYQSLFENLRDTVVVCDRDGCIRECHDGDAGLLGDAPDRLAGSNVAKTWPHWRFHGLTWYELIARVIGENGPIRLSDVVVPMASGEDMPVDVVAYGVEYADDRFAAIVFRNVTERHRLQRAARSADTMEAAVNFARGLAHDFKNLLHSAQLSLDRIRESVAHTDLADRAAAAAEACRQAASLSRRLTRFSAADEGEPEQLEPGEMVRLVLEALDEDLFASVEVRTQFNSAARVFIDRDQLTQILLNLVYNALDAMPDGGVLAVTIDEQPFSHPLTDQPPRPHVVLTVGDTGCGISPEALEHVFEPLFSTKPRTEAGPRGMGLAVVYAALNHAGGFVQIESTPKTGTAVKIYLPRVP